MAKSEEMSKQLKPKSVRLPPDLIDTLNEIKRVTGVEIQVTVAAALRWKFEGRRPDEIEIPIGADLTPENRERLRQFADFLRDAGPGALMIMDYVMDAIRKINRRLSER